MLTRIVIICLLSSPLLGGNLPPQKPLIGEKKLSCIAVQWTDNKFVTQEKCHNMNDFVAKFYHRNSRGKVTLKSFVGEVQTGVASTASNVALGEKMATEKFPGADYYLLANVNANPPNHSGGGISHLIQVNNNVATHEIGHLLGLGHATYAAGNPCCDKESIMNPDSKESSFLTAPQYYYLGWMEPSEYALWDGKTSTITLQNPLKAEGKQAMIIVPPSLMTKGGGKKFAYISFPPDCQIGKPCVALHIAATSPAGTQLVKEVPFGNTFYDDQYTGLNLFVIPRTDLTQASVQVSAK